jgi:hypothetical protein
MIDYTGIEQRKTQLTCTSGRPYFGGHPTDRRAKTFTTELRNLAHKYADLHATNLAKHLRQAADMLDVAARSPAPAVDAKAAAAEIEKFVPRYFSDDILCPQCGMDGGTCPHSLAQMLEAIITKHITRSPSVDAGEWVLVPREPTCGMLTAMHDGPLGAAGETMGAKQVEWLIAMYAAAIQSAPPPPSAPAAAHDFVAGIMQHQGATRHEHGPGPQQDCPLCADEIAAWGNGNGEDFAKVASVRDAIHYVLKSAVGCGGTVCTFPNGCGCAEDAARAVIATLQSAPASAPGLSEAERAVVTQAREANGRSIAAHSTWRTEHDWNRSDLLAIIDRLTGSQP